MHAQIGGADAYRHLDHRGLVHRLENEQIEYRGHKRDERRHHTEEQIGDIRRVPAIARLHQLLARFLLTDPFGEIELLDHRFHVLLG